MKQASVLQQASTPSLSEIQAQLQAAILDGHEGILALLFDGAHASRTTLLGVYRHAYMARLTEVLMNDYPLLSSYVGDDFFRPLARSFIIAHPSRSQNVRWFGSAFPEFLAKHESASEHPHLSELADIERSVANAFDSPDAPLLSVGDLALYPPNDWERLTFVFHPSVAFLQTTTNAFDLWKALKENEPPPDVVHLSSREHVAVWRHGTTPNVRRISNEEAMLCQEMRQGVPFGGLCEMLATYNETGDISARAAGYLQTWLAGGMLSSAKFIAQRAERNDAQGRNRTTDTRMLHLRLPMISGERMPPSAT